MEKIMSKHKKHYGFRVNEADKEILVNLAAYLKRTPSDTIRFSVRQVARDVGILPAKDIPRLGEVQKTGKGDKKNVRVHKNEWERLGEKKA